MSACFVFLTQFDFFPHFFFFGGKGVEERDEVLGKMEERESSWCGVSRDTFNDLEPVEIAVNLD